MAIATAITVLNKWHVVCKSSIYPALPNSIIYIKFEVGCWYSCLTSVSVCINVNCSIIVNSDVRLVHIRRELDSVCCGLEKLSLGEANSPWLLLSYRSEVGSIPDVLNFVDESFTIDQSVLADIVSFEWTRIKAVLSRCNYTHLII